MLYLLLACSGEPKDTGVLVEPTQEPDPNDRDGDEISNEQDCAPDDPSLWMDLECLYEDLRFVRLKAGSFKMGSPESEPGRDVNENQHRVTFDRDFYMLSTELTVSIYTEFMGVNPSEDFSDCGARCPVEFVSWHDAAYFSTVLSQQSSLDACYTCTVDTEEEEEGSEGNQSHLCSAVEDLYSCNGFRLPTEAEWEYAARAGTNASMWTPQGGGDFDEDLVRSCDIEITLSDGTSLGELAWFCHNAQEQVHEVASKTPNEWGFYDMGGNLREWVNDWYGDLPTEAVTNPTGALEANTKIAKGGCWSDMPKRLRHASRTHSNPERRSNQFGFRLVRLAPE